MTKRLTVHLLPVCAWACMCMYGCGCSSAHVTCPEGGALPSGSLTWDHVNLDPCGHVFPSPGQVGKVHLQKEGEAETPDDLALESDSGRSRPHPAGTGTFLPGVSWRAGSGHVSAPVTESPDQESFPLGSLRPKNTAVCHLDGELRCLQNVNFTQKMLSVSGRYNWKKWNCACQIKLGWWPGYLPL